MKISQPTPELLVPDVQVAQKYYRDTLGFDIAWYNQAGRIGAVSHGDCAIFFRASSETPSPSTFWVFCDDINQTHTELIERGADIVEPPEDKSWGLRQFTLRDMFGNKFYFFHDL